MNFYMKKQALFFSSGLLALILLYGCNGFFDPSRDPETGEEIPLLIMDMNFFTTRITFKLIDAKEGCLVTSPATVTFSGRNADDIVTFGGKKKSGYTTDVGELELTLDPNVEFSEYQPFEFVVHADIEGFSPMSKGVHFVSTGYKTVDLYLSKQSDQEEKNVEGELDINNGDTTFVFIFSVGDALKAAPLSDPLYEIQYSISLNSILKYKNQYGQLLFESSTEAMDAYYADPENFIVLTFQSFSDYPPWVDLLDIGGISQSVLFQLLETGTLTGLSVGSIPVGDLNGGVIASSASYTGTPVPAYFGFAKQTDYGYHITGTDTVYTSLGFSYHLISASDEVLCPLGTRIFFQSPIISSFSVTADVYDRQEPPEFISTLSFTGNFPDTFVVENTPPIPVTLVFRNNNPSLQPIPDLRIDNFCEGSATVSVEPQAGYQEYQIVLKGYCPDNKSVAIAPTYSGEYRLAHTTDPWQGTSMVGGVVDLLGLPDQEYIYRLLWENEWEYTTIWTEFDRYGNYLHETDSRSIHSVELPDGRIQISIEHDFTHSVCDKMNW